MKSWISLLITTMALVQAKESGTHTIVEEVVTTVQCSSFVHQTLTWMAKHAPTTVPNPLLGGLVGKGEAPFTWEPEKGPPTTTVKPQGGRGQAWPYEPAKNAPTTPGQPTKTQPGGDPWPHLTTSTSPPKGHAWPYEPKKTEQPTTTNTSETKSVGEPSTPPSESPTAPATTQSLPSEPSAPPTTPGEPSAPTTPTEPSAQSTPQTTNEPTVQTTPSEAPQTTPTEAASTTPSEAASTTPVQTIPTTPSESTPSENLITLERITTKQPGGQGWPWVPQPGATPTISMEAPPTTPAQPPVIPEQPAIPPTPPAPEQPPVIELERVKKPDCKPPTPGIMRIFKLERIQLLVQQPSGSSSNNKPLTPQIIQRAMANPPEQLIELITQAEQQSPPPRLQQVIREQVIPNVPYNRPILKQMEQLREENSRRIVEQTRGGNGNGQSWPFAPVPPTQPAQPATPAPNAPNGANPAKPDAKPVPPKLQPLSPNDGKEAPKLPPRLNALSPDPNSPSCAEALVKITQDCLDRKGKQPAGSHRWYPVDRIIKGLLNPNMRNFLDRKLVTQNVLNKLLRDVRWTRVCARDARANRQWWLQDRSALTPRQQAALPEWQQAQAAWKRVSLLAFPTSEYQSQIGANGPFVVRIINQLHPLTRFHQQGFLDKSESRLARTLWRAQRRYYHCCAKDLLSWTIAEVDGWIPGEHRWQANGEKDATQLGLPRRRCRPRNAPASIPPISPALNPSSPPVPSAPSVANVPYRPIP